jgi:L-threonylcarbamoyladenylate synthase
MKTLTINVTDNNSAVLAAELLNKGGTIIYPTETLYGLGGISTNEHAFLNIFEIKKRSITKPFPVLVKDTDMLMEYALIPDKAGILIQKFWPGPLTLILNIRKNVFPDLVNITKNINKVGFRVSSHYFLKNLFKFIYQPIISTSANISGTENIFSADELQTVFKNRVDLIIDSGSISASKGSTIVDCTVSPLQIVREGDIPYYELYEYI